MSSRRSLRSACQQSPEGATFIEDRRISNHRNQNTFHVISTVSGWFKLTILTVHPRWVHFAEST